jgi:hypothetical protein
VDRENAISKPQAVVSAQKAGFFAKMSVMTMEKSTSAVDVPEFPS